MKNVVKMTIAALLLGSMTGPAIAQSRDPAYQAARTQGQVGEGNDGYLAFVSTPSPAVKALIEDLNIRRRTEYTKIALDTKVTVSCAAQRAARTLIREKMVPGEKYQASNGSWQTRTGDAPDVATPACGG